MTHLNELFREYESRHYPPTRRLDLQGEGAATACDRTRRWIQLFAHEQPGADLLLVLERGKRREGKKSPVRLAVEGLLNDLSGKLVDWWQPFGPGSIALRIARDPGMFRNAKGESVKDNGEGRTPETAGAAYLHPEADIPEELLPLARRAAELRRTREGLGVSVMEVVLRGIWIEAQAAAMTEGVSFETALRRIMKAEEVKAYEDEDWD
ncbi:MAG: hypothetical protein JO040_06385 [Gemmatimonadetes bacterium]|nr:hypothetical protein [Gemmatimonadota bacterium]